MSVVPILYSRDVSDALKTLDAAHRELFDALVTRLRAGELACDHPPTQHSSRGPAPASGTSSGGVTLSRQERERSLGVRKPSQWRLAEMNLECWRLNPELQMVPKQFFLLWTCGIHRSETEQSARQCVLLWRLSGFRRMESARLAVLTELSLSSVVYLKLCLRRGPSGLRFSPDELADATEVRYTRFHAGEQVQPRPRDGAGGVLAEEVLEEVVLEDGDEEAEFLECAEDMAGGEEDGGASPVAGGGRVVLTEEQEAAVNASGPVLVQGRSGTAKTTILVERGIRHLLEHSRNMTPTEDDIVTVKNKSQKQKPLVLFVTASDRLARSVQKQFQDSFGSGSGEQHGAPPPRSFLDLPSSLSSLFLTYRQFAVMLDASIRDGEYFFEQSLHEKHVWDRFEAPKRVGGVSRERDGPEGAAGMKRGYIPENEVGFSEFAGRYWPKLPANLRKSLNVHDVYKELLLIKGCVRWGGVSSPSTETVVDFSRYLSRPEYLANPPPESLTRIQGLYSGQDRSKIYDLFERYQKQLVEDRAFDCVDVADNLWARAQAYASSIFGEAGAVAGFEGRIATCLLSDESQDLVMKQLLLFTLVCPEAREHCLAADPAQCIAGGRSFRLAAVKDAWNKVFSSNYPRHGGGDLRGIAAKPMEISLTKNYRSHQGILEFASRVVHILTRNFPGAVPAVPREVSPLIGETPVVVTGVTVDWFLQHLRTSSSATASFSDINMSGTEEEEEGPPQHPAEVEHGASALPPPGAQFGADQVVLTRCAAEKAKAEKAFAQHGVGGAVVLTVNEVKGLEFSDVLCWNFFSNGGAPEVCWLSLYEELEELAERVPGEEKAALLDKLNGWRDTVSRRPKQDKSDGKAEFRRQQRDSLWAQDLKELYVLATRARKRLLFFEEEKTVACAALLRDYVGRAVEEGVDVLMEDRDVHPSDDAGTISSTGASSSGRRGGPGTTPAARFLDGEGPAQSCLMVQEFLQASSAEEYLRRGMEYVGEKLFRAALLVFEASGNWLFALLGRALVAEEELNENLDQDPSTLLRLSCARAWLQLAEAVRTSAQAERGGTGAGGAQTENEVDVRVQELRVFVALVAPAARELLGGQIFEVFGDDEQEDNIVARLGQALFSRAENLFQSAGSDGSESKHAGEQESDVVDHHVEQKNVSIKSIQANNENLERTVAAVSAERERLETALKDLIRSHPAWEPKDYFDALAGEFPDINRNQIKNLTKRLKKTAEKERQTKGAKKMEEERARQEQAKFRRETRQEAQVTKELSKQFRVCLLPKWAKDDCAYLRDVAQGACPFRQMGLDPILEAEKAELGLILIGPFQSVEHITKTLDLAAQDAEATRAGGPRGSTKKFSLFSKLEQLHYVSDPACSPQLSFDFTKPPLKAIQFPRLRVFRMQAQNTGDFKIPKTVMPNLRVFSMRELDINGESFLFYFPRLEICRFYKITMRERSAIRGMGPSMMVSSANLKEFWTYQLFSTAVFKGVVFPELRKMTLYRCDNLECLHVFAPKLEVLDISGCYNLEELKFAEDDEEFLDSAAEQGFYFASGDIEEFDPDVCHKPGYRQDEVRRREAMVQYYEWKADMLGLGFDSDDDSSADWGESDLDSDCDDFYAQEVARSGNPFLKKLFGRPEKSSSSKHVSNGGRAGDPNDKQGTKHSRGKKQETQEEKDLVETPGAELNRVLKTGERVRLHSLRSRADLNGSCAKVLRILDGSASGPGLQTRRYEVRPEQNANNGNTLSIAHKNLALVEKKGNKVSSGRYYDTLRDMLVAERPRQVTVVARYCYATKEIRKYLRSHPRVGKIVIQKRLSKILVDFRAAGRTETAPDNDIIHWQSMAKMHQNLDDVLNEFSETRTGEAEGTSKKKGLRRVTNGKMTGVQSDSSGQKQKNKLVGKLTKEQAFAHNTKTGVGYAGGDDFDIERIVDRVPDARQEWASDSEGDVDEHGGGIEVMHRAQQLCMRGKLKKDDNKFVYSIPFGPESCPGGMLWWNQVLGASFLRMPDNFGLPPKEFAVVLKDSKKLAALCRKTGLTEEEVRRRSEPGIYSSRIGSLVPKETNPLTNPFLKPSDRRFMPPADKGTSRRRDKQPGRDEKGKDLKIAAWDLRDFERLGVPIEEHEKRVLTTAPCDRKTLTEEDHEAHNRAVERLTAEMDRRGIMEAEMNRFNRD